MTYPRTNPTEVSLEIERQESEALVDHLAPKLSRPLLLIVAGLMVSAAVVWVLS